MSKMISRKDFFKDSAKLAAGAAVGMAGLGMLKPGDTIAGTNTTWPLPYETLDVEEARIAGHNGYHTGGGCGYGGFEGVIGLLKEQVGGEFLNIPTEMMKWGAAGGASWGTLCGSLIGAATAINLCTTNFKPVISELFGWYCETAFPSNESNLYVHADDTKYNGIPALEQNISGSPLCHISVANWCSTAGFAGNSTERSERCSRLTGDVAAKAVELLNADLAGTFVPEFAAFESSEGCFSCHVDGLAPSAPKVKELRSDCVQCHGTYDTVHSTVTAVKHDEIVPYGFSISRNFPNPFNPTTTIDFEVDKAGPTSIKIYNIKGQEVKALLAENIQPGMHRVEWDGNDSRGVSVASGVYIVRLTSGRRVTSARMTLLK